MTDTAPLPACPSQKSAPDETCCVEVGSPDYELCQINEKKPSVLDELTAERTKLLATESTELEARASQLEAEIVELTGEEPSRIWPAAA